MPFYFENMNNFDSLDTIYAVFLHQKNKNKKNPIVSVIFSRIWGGGALTFHFGKVCSLKGRTEGLVNAEFGTQVNWIY